MAKSRDIIDLTINIGAFIMLIIIMILGIFFVLSDKHNLDLNITTPTPDAQRISTDVTDLINAVIRDNKELYDRLQEAEEKLRKCKDEKIEKDPLEF